MRFKKIEAGKVQSGLYYKIIKGNSIFMGGWHCCYIYAHTNIIKKIANKVDDIMEITYPSGGLDDVLERKRINKIGFDTAHYGNSGTYTEAKNYLEKWIEIARQESNE